jgi:methylated-DNA-[protein]-cysteine S-methyltransferase
MSRDEPRGQVFAMSLGWMAVVWSESGIQRVFLPQSSAQGAGRELEALGIAGWSGTDHSGLEAAVAGWERGDDTGLSGLKLHPQVWGPPGFRRKILEALRGVRRGQVVSYAELSRVAGNVRAARAAGNACASNPVPLLIPCHRVVASSGQLGGFMGRRGELALKASLLEREGVIVAGGKVSPELLRGRWI